MYLVMVVPSPVLQAANDENQDNLNPSKTFQTCLFFLDLVL